MTEEQMQRSIDAEIFEDELGNRSFDKRFPTPKQYQPALPNVSQGIDAVIDRTTEEAIPTHFVSLRDLPTDDLRQQLISVYDDNRVEEAGGMWFPAVQNADEALSILAPGTQYWDEEQQDLLEVE
jgi:hypothetical protein